MPYPYQKTLRVALADNAAISNSSTETIIYPDYTFNAYDERIYPGATLRLTCYWDASFVITTPGTLSFKLRWGGVSGTILAQSGAFAPDPTAALANRSGWVEFLTTWRTIGSAGSAMTMGRMGINDYDDATATTLQGNLNMGAIPTSAPAVVSSLDTTTAQGLSVTAKFSVATSGTNLTGHLYLLELLS